MRDDRRAFGGKRAEAAGVVEVVMRVDDVLDRLVRCEFFHLRDDGEGAGVVLRSFDHDQMIDHFHQHAVVGTAGQIPDAVRHLVGLHRDGGLARRCRAPRYWPARSP